MVLPPALPSCRCRMRGWAKPSTTGLRARPRQGKVTANKVPTMNEMMAKPVAAPSPDLLARFIAIVGEKNAITDPPAQAPYLLEMRDMYRAHTPVVLRPGSVAEVVAIVKLAS